MRSLRSAASLACLALLALTFAPSFRPRAVLARLTGPRDGQTSFDRRYGDFLEAVARATPDTATVAVLAPESNPRYFAEAAFRLAPRRVVGAGLSQEARYLAVYRRKPPPLPRGAAALPGGFLLTR